VYIAGDIPVASLSLHSDTDITFGALYPLMHFILIIHKSIHATSILGVSTSDVTITATTIVLEAAQSIDLTGVSFDDG